MTLVVDIVSRMNDQAKRLFKLFCKRCDHKFKKDLPAKFPLVDLLCPNCKTDGHVKERSR